MLTRFAIEPAALATSAKSIQDARERQIRKTSLRTLFDWWGRHGVLVDPRAGSTSVVSQVGNTELDPALRDLWRVALTQMGDARRISSGGSDVGPPINWSDLEAPSDFRSCRDTIRLALVEATRATVLGIADQDDDSSTYSVTCCGVDVTELMTFHLSKEYDRVDTLSSLDISSNENREDLWEERFAELARTSAEVVIVDRYGLEDLSADRSEKRFLTFLRFLERDARGCEVTLYTSCKAFSRDSSVVTRIDRELRNRITRLDPDRVRGVTVFLSPDDDFRRVFADRYIRFQQSICKIGHGLEIFAGPRVMRTNTFGYAAGPADLEKVKDTETKLKNRTKATIGEPFEYTPQSAR